MNAGTAIILKTGLLTACATLAMFAFGPCANATVIRVNFSGAYTQGSKAGTPFSGYADLQIGPDSQASSTFPAPTRPPVPLPPTAPPPPGVVSLAPGTNRVDPPHAQAITGATGMFNGHAIVDVMSIGPQTDPNPGEYIPASRTTLLTAGGPLTYDDLFYANGSPLTCLWNYPDGTTAAKYPFSGGFLDPYGVLFELDNGTYVDLWSNGVMPGIGLNYGVHLFTQAADGNYALLGTQFNGAMAAVPEPSYIWLFGVAVLGLFGWRRALESRKARRIV